MLNAADLADKPVELFFYKNFILFLNTAANRVIYASVINEYV
jgi:hypothetical protein